LGEKEREFWWRDAIRENGLSRLCLDFKAPIYTNDIPSGSIFTAFMEIGVFMVRELLYLLLGFYAYKFLYCLDNVRGS